VINPNIVAVRFIGSLNAAVRFIKFVNKTCFINETSTKNYFITSLIDTTFGLRKEIADFEPRGYQ